MPKGVIYLTPEQEARRDQLGLEAGLKGAAIGLGIGALGFIMVTRRSAEFRALSRPMQAIMPTAATVSGYLFASDRATSAYENANLGYTDEDLLMQLHDGEEQAKKTGFLAYLNENRWSVIGLSWAASMVGALGYSFSNRYLTTQQKVVQARMYAQAVTLAVLMASAGLSIYMGEDKKPKDLPDAQLRAVLELPVEENKRVTNTTSTKQPMN
ncbi:hypothetical protein O0I10_011027 [Lichtheimia ornata]|uniref:HIG1 domain-containing protein n=1 Tax=Lichtheimia ornata TaxID=688661 RepID=A0AAD7UUB2_9FUNG|nr:uncharacterized protein O0I10_011027 [Lichtheimia ornata]KAJ8653278.1 hypothetical protein O0I10_011027 [Lichtheimia ornata]